MKLDYTPVVDASYRYIKQPLSPPYKIVRVSDGVAHATASTDELVSIAFTEDMWGDLVLHSTGLVNHDIQ